MHTESIVLLRAAASRILNAANEIAEANQIERSWSHPSDPDAQEKINTLCAIAREVQDQVLEAIEDQEVAS